LTAECSNPHRGVTISSTPPALSHTVTLSHVHFYRFFFSSRRRHTRLQGDWSSDVCSSDLRSTPTGCRPSPTCRRSCASSSTSRKIGRASCRERVESSVGAGGGEKNMAKRQRGTTRLHGW